MGGHLYFVSEHQLKIYDKESQRIMGHPVENVNGYVNPSHCTGDEFVSTDLIYDVSTIGRTSYMKDPFYVHRKLDSINSVYTSVVVTTGGHHLKSGKEKKYYDENLKYNESTAPRTTFRDLPYIDGIKTMTNTKVFISTWPLETWGITALESLSHGVPTILLTDNTGTHASEGIAADHSHIRLIPKTAPVADLELAIAELSAYTAEKRREIALATQTKHSKQAFVNMYTKVFNDAVTSKNPKI
jgi:glycosyltransferase involved in cell wall biosynthesis